MPGTEGYSYSTKLHLKLIMIIQRCKKTIIVRILIFISILTKISESLKAKKVLFLFLSADDESRTVEMSMEVVL